MKILLDTNVWRYLVDADAVPLLRQAARKSHHRIAMAPGVFYEALRTGDRQLREKLVGAMASPEWLRLMPDAYTEAMELRNEVFRVRPAWKRSPPDLGLHRRLRFDWVRSKGGFWDRAVSDMEREAALVADTVTLDRARSEAQDVREDAKGQPQLPLDAPLDAIQGQPTEQMPGWNGDWIDLWRLTSMAGWIKTLQYPGHAYEEWLGGEIMTAFLRIPSADLTRFWCYDVRSDRLPSQWLRAAMTYLQRFHKVTDGTPVDAQISTYLLDVDLFLSADKNFVRFAQRCRDEAPFMLARAELVSATDALAHVLAALRRRRW